MKYYICKQAKVIATLTSPDQAVMNELISYGYSIIITNGKPEAITKIVSSQCPASPYNDPTPWPDPVNLP